MKLTHLRIQNFRSCREVSLDVGSMHALVGANNAGKSSVLHALDFLFNPSAKSLNEESFWNKDTNLEIRVEALFSDLTENEKEALGGYLKADGTFYIARCVHVFIYVAILATSTALLPIVAIVRGRGFGDSDGAPGGETTIVSQVFADRYFPGGDPVGRRIRFMMM